MARFLAGIFAVSKALHALAGVSLVFLMLLTVADVALLAFNRSVPGAMELVGFAGALAIGLTMPITSWRRGHVYVESFVLRLPPRWRVGCHIFTRLLGIALFVLLGWNLVRAGLELRDSEQVSVTLGMQYYPVVFGVAAAAFFNAVVLIAHIVKLARGEYE